MHCPACAYTLDDLPAGPCPECGRLFNPADPATVAKSPPGRWPLIITIAAAAWPTFLVVYLVLMYCIGALVLGHWPHRFGLDDPKAIPLVSWMNIAFGIFVAFSPVTLIVATVAALNCRGAPIVTLVLALACWGMGLAILISDPGQLMTWYLD